MVKKKVLTRQEKDLTRRYLVWCYKTTKEELDKIDRYFTQLDVDAFVLKDLRTRKKGCSKKPCQDFKVLVDEFESYMDKKRDNVCQKKFLDKERSVVRGEYKYLKARFCAIENAIKFFLGLNELNKIHSLYEEEMTRRILQAREH